MSNRARKKRNFGQATLRVGGAVAFPEVLRDFGVDPDAVLISAGIDPDLLSDPDNLITYAARSRLISQCVAITGCEHFGLLIGQRMNLDSLGLLGSLMKSAPDVGTALRALMSYFYIHTQGATTKIKVGGDVAVLCYDVIETMEVSTDQLGDGALAMISEFMHALCGPGFRGIEVSFAHRKPTDIKPFTDHFRIPMFFDAPHFSYVFSRHWLDVRLPTADTELQRRLQEQVDAIKLRRNMKFPEQVKHLLRSAILTQHCSKNQIAGLLGMTGRTLIRRLDTFGTCLQSLVDECRYEIALSLLENSSLQVQEIAEMLGYTRSSTFIRAFRRWSGTTPALWRATHWPLPVGGDHP